MQKKWLGLILFICLVEFSSNQLNKTGREEERDIGIWHGEHRKLTLLQNTVQEIKANNCSNYDNNYDSEAFYDGKLTKDGGFILGCKEYLFKYTPELTLEWGIEANTSTTLLVNVVAVSQLKSGNIALIGYYEELIWTTHYYTTRLIFFDQTDGSYISHVEFKDHENYCFYKLYDIYVEGNSGDIIVAGVKREYWSNVNTDSVGIVFRLDSNGNVITLVSYPNGVEFNSVFVTSDKQHIIVSGWYTTGSAQAVIIKKLEYSTLNVVWSNLYKNIDNNEEKRMGHMRESDLSTYIGAGYEYNPTEALKQFWFLEVTGDGIIQNSILLEKDDPTAGEDIVQVSKTSFTATGLSYPNYRQMFLVTLDLQGNELYSTTLGDIGEHSTGYSIVGLGEGAVGLWGYQEGEYVFRMVAGVYEGGDSSIYITSESGVNWERGNNNKLTVGLIDLTGITPTYAWSVLPGGPTTPIFTTQDLGEQVIAADTLTAGNYTFKVIGTIPRYTGPTLTAEYQITLWIDSSSTQTLNRFEFTFSQTISISMSDCSDILSTESYAVSGATTTKCVHNNNNKLTVYAGNTNVLSSSDTVSIDYPSLHGSLVLSSNLPSLTITKSSNSPWSAGNTNQLDAVFNNINGNPVTYEWTNSGGGTISFTTNNSQQIFPDGDLYIGNHKFTCKATLVGDFNDYWESNFIYITVTADIVSASSEQIGHMIKLTFSGKYSSTSENCESYIPNVTLNMGILGTNPKCLPKSPNTLEIYAGRGATMSPGNKITLNNPNIGGSFTITRNMPTLSLSISNSLTEWNQTQNAVIVATPTYVDGYSPTYAWSASGPILLDYSGSTTHILNVPQKSLVVGEYIYICAMSIPGAFAPILESVSVSAWGTVVEVVQLANIIIYKMEADYYPNVQGDCTGHLTSASIQLLGDIPPFCANSGDSLSIYGGFGAVIQVNDFISLSSSYVYNPTYTILDPFPAVSLGVEEDTLYFTPDQEYNLIATPEHSEGLTFNFNWRIDHTETPTKSLAPSTTIANKLLIYKNSLSVGNYTMSVNMTIDNSHGFSATNNLKVLVASSPYADIQGANATYHEHIDILLSGNRSLDMDTDTLSTDLGFTWTCYRDKSLTLPCTQIPTSTKTIELLIPSNSLSIGIYYFQLRVSKWVHFSSTRLGILNITESIGPMFGISCNQNWIINQGEYTIFKALIFLGDTQSESGSGRLLTDMRLLSETTYIWQTEPIIRDRIEAEEYFTIPKNALIAGTTYKITCQITDSTGTSTLTLSFYVSKTINVGTFLITPINGLAFDDIFEIKTDSWTDMEGGPLEYKYIYKVIGGSQSITLNNWTPYGVINKQLPVGREAFSYIIQITVVAKNSLSATAWESRNITVRLGDMAEGVSLTQFAVDYINANQGDIKQEMAAISAVSSLAIKDLPYIYPDICGGCSQHGKCNITSKICDCETGYEMSYDCSLTNSEAEEQKELKTLVAARIGEAITNKMDELISTGELEGSIETLTGITMEEHSVNKEVNKIAESVSEKYIESLESKKYKEGDTVISDQIKSTTFNLFSNIIRGINSENKYNTNNMKNNLSIRISNQTALIKKLGNLQLRESPPGYEGPPMITSQFVWKGGKLKSKQLTGKRLSGTIQTQIQIPQGINIQGGQLIKCQLLDYYNTPYLELDNYTLSRTISFHLMNEDNSKVEYTLGSDIDEIGDTEYQTNNTITTKTTNNTENLESNNTQNDSSNFQLSFEINGYSGGEVYCVYYNETLKNYSAYGMQQQMIQTNGETGTVYCSASHLTEFAISDLPPTDLDLILAGANFVTLYDFSYFVGYNPFTAISNIIYIYIYLYIYLYIYIYYFSILYWFDTWNNIYDHNNNI